MTIQFDASLLAKYNIHGPRYTSYPTAIQFTPDFDDASYRNELTNSGQGNRPLSLYFHIPFCKSLCFYCACAKIITHKQSRAAPYLQRLHKEIEIQGRLVDPQRQVTQLHFGGGTPTFISDLQLTQLLEAINQHFTLADPAAREFSIEIDPRAVRPTTIPLLRELGFNRISLGVQDFNPTVQAAVNRIQSVEQTFAVIDDARAAGYKSVNLDLIYGLPFQTVESFSETLNTVLLKRPERLAIYNYAHMPDKIRAQKLINSEDLPSAETKLDILGMTIARLESAGYVYLGMDHFALPEDDLAIAKQEGTLQRNFQGYSTHADSDLIGMGITAISKINDSFSQNLREEEDYFDAIDAGNLATHRGYQLSQDDKIRRDIIQLLMCQNRVDFTAIEKAYGIDFFDYFYDELRQIALLSKDGLVTLDKSKMVVTPNGQLLLRNIAMVFDAYIHTSANQQLYSKVI